MLIVGLLTYILVGSTSRVNKEYDMFGIAFLLLGIGLIAPFISFGVPFSSSIKYNKKNHLSISTGKIFIIALITLTLLHYLTFIGSLGLSNITKYQHSKSAKLYNETASIITENINKAIFLGDQSICDNIPSYKKSPGYGYLNLAKSIQLSGGGGVYVYLMSNPNSFEIKDPTFKKVNISIRDKNYILEPNVKDTTKACYRYVAISKGDMSICEFEDYCISLIEDNPIKGNPSS